MPVNNPNEFILDSSVTLIWAFDDESSSYGEKLLDQMPKLQAYVPTLWSFEVSNALLVGERRERLKPADTLRFLALLAAFPINIDSETTARASSDTVNLARIYNLSIYDAAYLEVAIRKGLPLATVDNKLKSAAQLVGVPAYEVC
jgi:predicted nucleic acid-binding protein